MNALHFALLATTIFWVITSLYLWQKPELILFFVRSKTAREGRKFLAVGFAVLLLLTLITAP